MTAQPRAHAHPGNPPAGIHGVLSVLEEMAAQVGGGAGSSVPGHFHWLPGEVDAWRDPSGRIGPLGRAVDDEAAERFGALDAIRPQVNSLRLGFGWLAGRSTGGSEGTTRLFEPLLTMPVVVQGNSLQEAGDLELTPLVEDRAVRWQIEQEAGGGQPSTQSVQELLVAICRAGGFDPDRVVPTTAAPSTLRAADDLALATGVALFAIGTRPEFSPAAALATWQTAVGTRWTALHTLYLDRPPPPLPGEGLNLPSAYPLTQAQHDAVDAARTNPVTVIAGAPGTGKTHTIAAIVGDAVAHGRSVLVAAKADATVEAITELLQRRPGPDPVVFGASNRRWELGRRLAAGEPQPVPSQEVARRRGVMLQAQSVRDEVWGMVSRGIAGMALLADGPGSQRLHRRLPGLRRPGSDLFDIQALITRTGGSDGSWWQIGHRRAWSRLLTALEVEEPPTVEDLAQVDRMAVAARRLHAVTDGLSDGLEWEELAAAQHSVEARTGEWMDAVARDEARLGRHGRGNIGALAKALRTGRAARRSTLATLAGQDITGPLPVWVGTLADIDDLLPLRPGMFDTVVLDEASSIDQPRAAAALLRGSRAVIVGDPQQLRHVSFVSQESIEIAQQTHVPAASAALQAKLDVRGSSIFDVAAASAPVRTLDEHFRSSPHLFGFVGSRLYRGQVSMATRTPLTDREDRISLVRLDAARNNDKVVVAEVRWVMERLAELRRDGVRSVGVISPFRAQADAIEEAALRGLRREGIQELGLRVGTVHAFQGMERDVVLASVGVGRGDSAMTWRFVNDPHLFAVFATRARQRIEVVMSCEPPEESLLADYVAQVDDPPPPPAGITQADDWTRSVAEGLQDAGVQVIAPYPAGRHQVDLVIHDDRRSLAVETRLHPEGAHAHLRRHLELRNAGWPIRAALRATWQDRRGELVVALADALGRL